MKKIIALVLIAALFVTLAAACATPADKNTDGAEATAVEKIKANGKIVMYCNANFPPYEYLNGTEVVGIDVEIGKAIAEKLGVTLEIKNTAFDGIVVAIASGSGDMAITGMTITEERKLEVDFSNPYINSVQYLILKEDSDLETVESLAGMRVAAVLGYTGSLILGDELLPGGEVLENGEVTEPGVLAGSGMVLSDYNSAGDATLALTSGKADAVIMDEMVAKSIVASIGGLKAVKLTYEDGSDTAEEYGVAIQKGKEDLLAVINEVIDELVANGKIEEFMNLHVMQDAE